MNQNDKMSFLANAIKNSKQVLDKVESNTSFPGGNTITRRPLTESDIDNMLEPEEMVSEQHIQQPYKMSGQRNLANSKMPPEILKSFASMPAIDPTQPVGMDLMMNEIVQKVTPQQQPKRRMVENTPVQTYSNNKVTETVAPQMDVKLMEYIIKKTVEETLEQVSKKTNLSENIQIKIGDKTFSGKITSLNEVKKTTKKG